MGDVKRGFLTGMCQGERRAGTDVVSRSHWRARMSALLGQATFDTKQTTNNMLGRSNIPKAKWGIRACKSRARKRGCGQLGAGRPYSSLLQAEAVEHFTGDNGHGNHEL